MNKKSETTEYAPSKELLNRRHALILALAKFKACQNHIQVASCNVDWSNLYAPMLDVFGTTARQLLEAEDREKEDLEERGLQNGQ